MEEFIRIMREVSFATLKGIESLVERLPTIYRDEGRGASSFRDFSRAAFPT